ncbi:hypothetical protein R1sor_025429 [Riccia sorocarpa]|uniref:Uncharacterized protein n=1 Tax=Riccia sorocarpa TaxID=122646 RepID=A0ABD3GA56_9MARC
MSSSSSLDDIDLLQALEDIDLDIDLSPHFKRVTLPHRSYPFLGRTLTGRTFNVIFLKEAIAAITRYSESPYRGYGPSPGELAATLKPVGSSTLEHKMLYIDDFSDYEKSLRHCDFMPDLPSFLEYVFSPLLSNQTSLEAIYVRCEESKMFGAALKQIGKLLAKGSTLEILWFSSCGPSMEYSWGGDNRVSDAVVKTLSKGLIHSKCLRTVGLTLGGPLERRFADVLKSACSTDVQNTSLEWIELPAAMERLHMALEMLLSNSFKNLKMIHIGLSGDADESTVDKFQMVVECLRRCQQPDFDTSKIVRLDCNLEHDHTHHNTVMAIWDKWVGANECALLLETRLLVLGYGQPWGWGRGGWEGVQRWEGGERWGAVVREMLTPSTQLKSLHICFEWGYFNFRGEQPSWLHDMETSFSLLCKSIQSIDSVETISIHGQEEILVRCGPPLFQCLHHKRRLTELTCNGPWYVDVVFRSLMDLLQVNIYLEVVNLDKYGPEDNGGNEGKKSHTVLKLTIGDVNKEWLRHISVNALKVIWALVKAGVDAQLPGVGGLIPELGDLSGGLVPVTEMTLQELKNAKFSTLPTVERSGVADDVWKFLRSTVQPATIPEDFELELVRYNLGTVAVDQSYAWLCQKCVDEGEKNHVLKCI